MESYFIYSPFFINIFIKDFLVGNQMALWGNKDSVGSGGLVSLSQSGDDWIVTGSGTTFGQVGAASTGDVIRFGDRSGIYYGDAVVVGIASTEQLTIGSTSGLSAASIASTTFSISQLPVYTIGDSKYSEASYGTEDSYVYGVSEDEIQASNLTQYSATHAGWVGITTYVDSDGNLRIKNEVLVAMSSIVQDAEDDEQFPDKIITILTQPSSVGVGTTDIATFSISATSTPLGSLSYQWQYSSTGIAYTDLANNSTYSGVTAPYLNVTNTDDSLDGSLYRVNVSATDAVTVTSNSATMSVS